jgi:hypothetical protein
MAEEFRAAANRVSLANRHRSGHQPELQAIGGAGCVRHHYGLAQFELIGYTSTLSSRIDNGEIQANRRATAVYADLVVRNANILTVDASDSVAEAVAVNSGRFAAVGANHDIEASVGPSTEVVDAGGRTVLPGFIDAHCHLLSVAAKQLLQVDCSPAKAKSIDDIIRALQSQATKTDKGKWILGARYDDTKLAERRHPTRWDLDRASTEHPIHLRHVSGHLGVVNTPAFEAAGITKQSKNPEGDSFDRDPEGELTGVCREEADFLFLPGIGGEGSVIPPLTREQELAALQLACKEYNSFGITSVGDALVTPSEIDTLQSARQSGSLTVRVYMMILDSYLPPLRQLQLRTGFGNDWLRFGSIKSFVDGAIAGRTAWLSEPYEGRPDDYGIPTKTAAEIDRIVMEAHRAGFQVAVHANGDRAIQMVLDAYEKALRERPRSDHRHRIAHCTVVTPEILKRIKSLGVVVLPFSTYIYEHGDKMGEYGKRISMMFAHRSFLDYGIPVGGSSDNPCATQDPLLAIRTMVTRRSSEGEVLGPEQRVSPREAIRIYTMGSAYASFEEGSKGSIEPGKLADFVVLSEDPTRVPPEEIHRIVVDKTYVDGKEVYSRD